MPDPAQINTMFARIAPRYDAANRVLSLGTDRWWRHRLVAAACRIPPQEVLDLATGSGDVALALARVLPAGAMVQGMDFCAPMIAEAVKKLSRTGGLQAKVAFLVGDALALPLADESIDVVTIAFGLRNLADRARGFREMRRVLRPGGRLLVLEFSQPAAWFRPAYYFYLRQVLPWLATRVTGDRAAYEYLGGSVGAFPDHAALAAEMLAAGFVPVNVTRMTLGIVALHEGTRPLLLA